MLDFSSDINAIGAAIDGSTSAGNTNVGPPLNLARETFNAAGRPTAHQVVLVLLDGIPNDYTSANNRPILDAAVADMQAQGTIMAVGYSASVRASRASLSSPSSSSSRPVHYHHLHILLLDLAGLFITIITIFFS